MYLYGVFCCRQSGALLEAGVTQRSVGPCHPDARCLSAPFSHGARWRHPFFLPFPACVWGPRWCFDPSPSCELEKDD